MNFKTEIHLGLIVTYAIVANFKSQVNFIDAVIIISFLASMLYQMKLDHSKLPDIRKESEEKIRTIQKEMEDKLISFVKEHGERVVRVEKETADIKAGVAPFIGSKSVGLSNVRF